MNDIRVVDGQWVRLPDVECAPDWQCHDRLFYRITEPVARELDAERVAARNKAQRRAHRRLAMRAIWGDMWPRLIGLAVVVGVILWGPR